MTTCMESGGDLSIDLVYREVFPVLQLASSYFGPIKYSQGLYFLATMHGECIKYLVQIKCLFIKELQEKRPAMANYVSN